MRRILLILCAVTAFVVSSCGPAGPVHPNIVIILADDLGFGDPGSYNSASLVPTPNLDRLADQGMRFTDAHTPSAVCSPTRYGLLTGRYAWRTELKSGVLWGWSTALIEEGRTTIPSLLQAAGYRTGGVGKWHLGLGTGERTDYGAPLLPGPTTVGFDYYYGIPASLDMQPYLYFENDRVVASPTDSIEGSTMRRNGGGGFWRTGPRSPGFRHIDVIPILTGKAVRFVEEQKGSSDPFFLYFALSAPHTPWLPTDEFVGRSGAGPYGDFVTQVDDAIGQVLAALEASGAADNTLLFVTSDNGAHWLETDIEGYGHRANGRLRGQKADIWEGGHRVPFIARWPGRVEAGAISGETIVLTDLLATVADVIGVQIPPDSGEDSYSILRVLEGADLEGPIREATVHHSMDGMFAIRKGDWKLILGLGSGGFTRPARIDPEPGEPPGQLYDLAVDPGENMNVYLEHPDIVDELTELLSRYRDGDRSVPE